MPTKKVQEERAQMTIRILGSVKDRLRALAVLKDQYEYLILEDAFEAYWSALPENVRKDAEGIAETIKRHRPRKK